MSEMIVTFQSQLSGVMETVFKAAIFEITRLVEDSFLEEVSRSRKQVESLKRKLHWSESRRRDQEGGTRVRCVDCANNVASSNQDREEDTTKTGGENAPNLKQERNAEENWKSCTPAKMEGQSGMVESGDVSRRVDAAEPVVQKEVKLNSTLKAEKSQNSTGAVLQDEWRLSTEATEGSDNSAQSKTYSEQELQQIQDDWSSGLDQAADPEREPDMENIHGLPYRTRYTMEDLGSYSNQELDPGELNGLTNSPQRAGGVMGFGVMAASLQADLGTVEQTGRRIRNKRGNKGSSSLHAATDTGDMNCLLINEEGYLQDMSALPQAPGELAGDLGHRGHSMYGRDTVNDNSDCFYGGDTFSNPLNLNHEPVQLAGVGDQRSHTCTQCMIGFPDQASLKAHMLSHRNSSNPSYVCNQCGKKFTQACNLKVHQRIHQRDGLHLCSHCGKGYSSFADLRRHRCSQAGDKPYSCTLCGNKFSRLWNLKLHRRIHTQEKPHRCNMCDKSFTRADILKVHQRTHTGERPYCCRVCGLSFKRLDHLRSHQRKHGSDMNNH